MINLVRVLTLSAVFRMVQSSSRGATSAACAKMEPVHGGAVAQKTVPPFSVILSSRFYGCNESVTVTVMSDGSANFKGFLCQPRQDPNVYMTFGTLRSAGDVSMANNCDKHASFTHTSPDVKTSVTFNWTEPGYDVGPVLIVCTIVKDYLRFWTLVTSEQIIYSPTCSDHVTNPSTNGVTSSGITPNNGTATNGVTTTVQKTSTTSSSSAHVQSSSTSPSPSSVPTVSTTSKNVTSNQSSVTTTTLTPPVSPTDDASSSVDPSSSCRQAWLFQMSLVYLVLTL